MKTKLAIVGALATVTAGALLAFGGTRESQPDPRNPSALAALPADGIVHVYKSPTCGCCGDWVEHLRAAGFEVKVENVQDMVAVKRRLGVPDPMASCHTAVVDGYVVEGHVPAEDLRRFLVEAPDLAGIAVPGMPVGSPGMEVEGQPAQPYDVLAFDAQGRTKVFAEHR